MLKGIDVSSHDGWSNGRFGKQNTETAYGESDFVIAKATQGTGYVNKYCDPAIKRAKRDGKLWGFYHYAGGNDPVAEANFFYNNCKNYFGEGIPCLDWESTQNASWGSTTWCRRFVDRIYELTGVWCMIYIQASAVNQAANCANDCALWIAGYPDNRNSWDMPTFRYGTGAWQTWTLWQYTSSGELTDRNVSTIGRDEWVAIAKGENAMNANDVWSFDNNGDPDGQNAWRTLKDIDSKLEVYWNGLNGNDGLLATVYGMRVAIEAQAEAIKDLSSSVGANPDDIAESVSNAVSKKLSELKISIKSE